MTNNNNTYADYYTVKRCIDECHNMVKFHTDMSLNKSKLRDTAKAKEHARKAQIYQQELHKLSI